MNFCMPSGFSAPVEHPGVLDLAEAGVEQGAAWSARVPPSGMVNGGEEEYDVTIGRSPSPPPAVKSTS